MLKTRHDVSSPGIGSWIPELLGGDVIDSKCSGKSGSRGPRVVVRMASSAGMGASDSDTRNGIVATISVGGMVL